MAHRRFSSILRRNLASVALLALTLSVSAPAHAESAHIWYRAGERCPEGPSFLERLERRGVQARLAGVGDRIDFVVTLAANEQKSSGRLERQTKQGTVAVREVEDASCDAVADILALSLALTVEPHDAAPEAVAPSSAPVPNPAPPSPPTTVPPPRSSTERPAATRAPQASPAPEPERRGVLLFGVDGSAWNVFGSSWLVGGGAVAEVRGGSDFALPTASMRVVLQGGAVVAPDAVDSLWLAAFRLEACPLALGSNTLEIRPCVAVDLGGVGANAAGEGDAALWSALAAHARVSLALSQALRVEAQAGVLLPLTRYEVSAGTPARSLEKTNAIGFAAGLGTTFRVP